jgi:hypothetical protein
MQSNQSFNLADRPAASSLLDSLSIFTGEEGCYDAISLPIPQG